MKLPCDVTALNADLATVDALARLQLRARRRGDEVELRDGSAELWALLAFVGLSEVFDRWDPLPLDRIHERP